MKFFRFGNTDTALDLAPIRRMVKLALKWLLGSFFVLSGAYHFLRLAFDPELNLLTLSWPNALIHLSGAFEMMLGIVLFFRTLQIIAAWSLIALLIVVSPAHIYIAISSRWESGVGSMDLWARFALQLVLIAWTFWYTRSRRKKRVLPAVAPKPVNTGAPQVATATPAVPDTANTQEKAPTVKKARRVIKNAPGVSKKAPRGSSKKAPRVSS
jgi:uncharacterized membrane protein